MAILKITDPISPLVVTICNYVFYLVLWLADDEGD